MDGLPPDSAVWRTEQPWTVTDHLIVSMIEVFDHWMRQNLVARGAKESQLPEPIDIPRPGEEPEQKTPTAVQNMRALLTEQGGGR